MERFQFQKLTNWKNSKDRKPLISIRTSMSDYRRDDWLTNLPLYAVENYWK